MDRQSSVNCTRVTLVVTNLLLLLLGVSGFILGFARPNALYFVSISGLQVSVASLCLIGSASLGLLSAITLNYHLLLSYATLIISSFLLRIIWSITAYIHSTVFILDCSASTTILSTIASFFIMLFALLLAHTSKNDDTTSKAKLINNSNNSKAMISSMNATQNSILKGSLNNENLKRNDKKDNKQKNILTAVNCISATPSPISNQSSLTSPSSQQSLQHNHQHNTRHHHYVTKSTTPIVTSSSHYVSHYNQHPPIVKSTSNKHQQQKHRHKKTNNTNLIV